MDLRQLITDVLIYDVVVFPCPEDETDFNRWETNGWDPESLAMRVTQLGDSAVTIPWDMQLRREWQDRFDSLSEAQKKDPSRAYLLTAEQLADRSFVTLVGEEDDRFNGAALNPPEIHPAFAARDGRGHARKSVFELVAAFQRPEESVVFTGPLNRQVWRI
jgi:hypothetical protein